MQLHPQSESAKNCAIFVNVIDAEMDRTEQLAGRRSLFRPADQCLPSALSPDTDFERY